MGLGGNEYRNCHNNGPMWIQHHRKTSGQPQTIPSDGGAASSTTGGNKAKNYCTLQAKSARPVYKGNGHSTDRLFFNRQGGRGFRSAFTLVSTRKSFWTSTQVYHAWWKQVTLTEGSDIAERPAVSCIADSGVDMPFRHQINIQHCCLM